AVNSHSSARSCPMSRARLSLSSRWITVLTASRRLTAIPPGQLALFEAFTLRHFRATRSVLVGASLLSRPAPFVVSERGALLRFCRVHGVELTVALLDAATPLVPGKSGADMVWPGILACSGDFPLRLAGCQSKNPITEAR